MSEALSKTPFLDAVQKLKAERENAEFKLKALLRKRGWEETSFTPGCRWMWTKRLKKYHNELVMVSFEDAIDFEVELCGERYEAEDTF